MYTENLSSYTLSSLYSWTEGGRGERERERERGVCVRVSEDGRRRKVEEAKKGSPSLPSLPFAEGHVSLQRETEREREREREGGRDWRTPSINFSNPNHTASTELCSAFFVVDSW